MTKKGVIYAIGVFVLGLMYAWLKSTFGNPTTFAITIIYVVILRLVAEKFGE